MTFSCAFHSWVWVGVGGDVQSEQRARPTRSVEIVLGAAAGPMAGTVAGAALAAVLLAVAGAPSAVAMLGLGAEFFGVVQFAGRSDVVFVGRGLAALFRGWRVVAQTGAAPSAL